MPWEPDARDYLNILMQQYDDPTKWVPKAQWLNFAIQEIDTLRQQLAAATTPVAVDGKTLPDQHQTGIPQNEI